MHKQAQAKGAHAVITSSLLSDLSPRQTLCCITREKKRQNRGAAVMCFSRLFFSTVLFIRSHHRAVSVFFLVHLFFLQSQFPISFCLFTFFPLFDRPLRVCTRWVGDFLFCHREDCVLSRLTEEDAPFQGHVHGLGYLAREPLLARTASLPHLIQPVAPCNWNGRTAWPFHDGLERWAIFVNCFGCVHAPSMPIRFYFRSSTAFRHGNNFREIGDLTWGNREMKGMFGIFFQKLKVVPSLKINISINQSINPSNTINRAIKQSIYKAINRMINQ